MPTPRYALGIDLAPLQFERVSGGTSRFRVEPKLSYGVLPFTELEVRVPVVRVDPPRATGVRSVTGVASVAVGALHAFNLETQSRPALALGAEVALPIGRLAGPSTSYMVKGLATKTLPFVRLHVNGGLGTYSVRSSTSTADTVACPRRSGFRFPLPGQQQCASGPPIIFDSPCSVQPVQHGRATASRMCMGAFLDSVAPPLDNSVRGSHWFAGAGVDHAFALQSILITADIVAEHFVGLYAPIDWTSEAGIRRQMTPTLMIDAGVAWHFAGAIRSTSFMLGVTYDLATPPLFRGQPNAR